MKKLLFIFSLALTLCACNKHVTSKAESIPADSLLIHVFRAVIDTNISCLEYKDEFMMFMDTLQTHVESYPDEDIRIGAKSFAMDLFGLFMYGDFTTQEENRFFADSLIIPLANIQHTWYIPPYVLSKETVNYHIEPVLEQTLVLQYNDENHVIFMELYSLPNNDEAMVITLPTEASYLASICFHDERMQDMDTTATFNLMNARNVRDEEEGLGQQIVYGDDFIEAMLSYEGLYIAYIGDEDADDIRERWHDAHLDLKPFHRQYPQVKQLLKEANEAL